MEIIEAPSNLGLRPPAPGREPGVRRMPDALRAAGLHARLAPAAVRRVEPPPYGFDLDPALGVRNAAAIADYSRRLADAVDEALAAGRLPLVLGGDCSVLLGGLLALGRRGRHALLFADGHTDFGTPATSRTGGAAGMDLAIACGRGLPLLTRLGGVRPLVEEADVVAFGFRDMPDPATHPWREVLGTRIERMDLARVRALGTDAAIRAALGYLAGRPTVGFWLHVDLDVVDSALLPAVDSPQPDGLSFEDLERLLRLARGASGFRGADITIFDPDLDPAGRLAARLAEVIAEGLG